MKQITLTDKEINVIHAEASKNFARGRSANRQRNFLCECLVEAFLDYCAHKGYIVQNGKIYTDENRTK